MKKIFGILLLIPLVMGCNKQKIVTLEFQNDSLVQQSILKEQSIHDFLVTLNSIQENLNAIKASENHISLKFDANTELKKEARERINDDISVIYNLLGDTRSKLEDAKKKLGTSSFKINEFEIMVINLTRQIEQKDSSLVALRSEIGHMNLQIVSLNKTVIDLTQWNEEKEDIIVNQVQIIDNKDQELNTAYVAIGTKKELKEEKIITTVGGFIGIGKAEKLNQGIDDKLFTRIDTRQVTQIPLLGKKQQIVTPHDTASYEIREESDQRILQIVDKDKFWKSSKYLVVINN